MKPLVGAQYSFDSLLSIISEIAGHLICSFHVIFCYALLFHQYFSCSLFSCAFSFFPTFVLAWVKEVPIAVSASNAHSLSNYFFTNIVTMIET